jgi:hypothetical protein
VPLRNKFCVLADGKQRVAIEGVGTWCLVVQRENRECVELRLHGGVP